MILAHLTDRPGPPGFPNWPAAGPPAGAYSACPLCGLADGGSEHLLVWCPAVSAAWAQLAPAAGSVLHAVFSGPHTPLLARLLHQASYFHCSLRGAPLPWHRARDWLCRGVLAQGLGGGDGDAADAALAWASDETSILAQDAGGDPAVAAWGRVPPDCAVCSALPPRAPRP